MPRQHKGDRDQMTVRPPREVGAIIRARALRAGVDYGTYASAILSEYVGLSHLQPLPPTPDIFDLLQETTVPLQENNMPRSA